MDDRQRHAQARYDSAEEPSGPAYQPGDDPLPDLAAQIQPYLPVTRALADRVLNALADAMGVEEALLLVVSHGGGTSSGRLAHRLLDLHAAARGEDWVESDNQSHAELLACWSLGLLGCEPELGQHEIRWDGFGTEAGIRRAVGVE